MKSAVIALLVCMLAHQAPAQKHAIPKVKYIDTAAGTTVTWMDGNITYVADHWMYVLKEQVQPGFNKKYKEFEVIRDKIYREKDTYKLIRLNQELSTIGMDLSYLRGKMDQLEEIITQ